MLKRETKVKIKESPFHFLMEGNGVIVGHEEEDGEYLVLGYDEQDGKLLVQSLEYGEDFIEA